MSHASRGPWTVETSDLTRILDADGATVATVETYPYNTHCRDNACVIAVAPEVIDGLKALLDAWWREFSDFFGGDSEVDEQNKADFEAHPVVTATRALIAKAEGAATSGPRKTETTHE